MRLLHHTNDGQLEFTSDFISDDKIPPYAILSHTWQEGHEVTFDDMVNSRGENKAGYNKIRFCARQAARDHLRYFWVDTCCIDKSSSAELSEAINSMFRWYQNAECCYVYLPDVSSSDLEEGEEPSRRWKPAFKKSRWFTRGWTLQELIAPTSVEFFSFQEERLGDKRSLEQTLHEITGIPYAVLRGSSLRKYSVEERFLWGATRQTTRKEDKAYCLLGIFDIQMPLLYGEGDQKAFARLRKEIKDGQSFSLPIAKGASFNSYENEHNTRCLPDTRVELLNDITKWSQENTKDSKSMFWLSGMAGTGKSTIARTVAKSFFEEGKLGASFFFKRGEGDRGNASRFFSTIATELAVCEPDIIPGIRSALDADSAVSERALRDQFEKLILQPLSGMQKTYKQPTTRFVIIDALDECEREEDIGTILQLLAQMKGVSPLSLRFIVSSRPELHIRLGFKQLPNGTYQDLILHEVPQETIEHDIRVYLEHELGIIRKLRVMSLSWPTVDQIQALINLAVPLFIYAATVCRYIGTKGGDPEANLGKVLEYRKSTFSQLDRTYLPVLDHLLSEQEEEDKESWLLAFRELVGSIIHLEEPLSIASIARLLQIPQKQVVRRLDSLHSILSVPDDRNNPVRVLHLSFREFLVNPQQHRRSPFWVDEQAAHGRLAAHCLELMSNPGGLHRHVCGLLRPGVSLSEIDGNKIIANLSPELQYSCSYWVDHVIQSQRQIVDEDMTHVFLQKHFLHWIEAMSFMKKAEKCVSLIGRLQSLTQSTESKVVSFLRDARRFLFKFQPIQVDYPLQLYHSAMVFAPETSIIRQTFEDQAPQWVEMLAQREEDWSTCRSTLEGHSDYVNGVAFSPNGRQIASSSFDRTIRLWDVDSCQTLQTLEGHSDSVRTVAFSQDGQLASAADDNTVRLWDVNLGQTRLLLEGHSAWIWAIAFSLDCKQLASVSSDKTIRLWDTSSGQTLGVLEGHELMVLGVAFSPDGQLASGSADKTIRIWDTKTGQTLRILEGHTDWVRAISFSSNGELLASASSDKTVMLWNTSGKILRVLKGHSNAVRAVAFSPDGNKLASASSDDTIRLWNMSGQTVQVLEGHLNWIRALAFSPNGHQIASASSDRTVKVWDHSEKAQGRMEGISDWTKAVLAVTFSSDGRHLASISADKTVRLWDIMGQMLQSLEGPLDWVSAMIFSLQGKQLVPTSDEKTVRLWDGSSGETPQNLETFVTSLRFDRCGSFLETDFGALSVVPSIPASSTLQKAYSAGVSSERDWIEMENQKVLWLPPEYRPGCVAVRHNVIAIGCPSGRLVLLNFNVESFKRLQDSALEKPTS